MTEAVENLEQEIEQAEAEVEEVVTDEVTPELPEGFQTREQWEEAGKNPDDWRSPKTFEDFRNITEANKRLNQKVEHLTKSFDERMQGVNTLHKAQLETQASKLNAQKQVAIEDADVDKVRQIDKDLAANSVQQQQITQPQQEYLRQVGTWFNDTEAALKSQYPAKAIDIQDKMTAILTRHTAATIDTAASEFEAFAKSLAPTKNPRRLEPNKTTTSGSRGKGKLSMSDVTAEEKEQRQWFKTDKAFLQACQDVRGEQK